MLRRLLELLGIARPVPVAPLVLETLPANAGIADVLARMETLERELGPDDGVRWFNRLYLEVTRRVAVYDRTGQQKSPGFLEHLDVAFADRYFTALAAAGNSPGLPDDYPYHAWKPLFEARRRRDVAPVQFALAGMNAHINHDLALGVSAVCVARGVEPAPRSPEHTDYEAVNPLIAAAEAAVKSWLMTGLLADLDRELQPADDVVAVWSVERARAAAWTRSEVIWSLSGDRRLRDDYIAANDHTVGLASRAMLVPVGLA